MLSNLAIAVILAYLGGAYAIGFSFARIVCCKELPATLSGWCAPYSTWT
jgi:hypothetical protein